MTAFLKNIKLGKGFLAALLAVFALAAYADTIPGQMFWDDNDFILNNRYIKDWRHIPEMFSQNVIAGSDLGSNYWRPALLLIFSAEWHAWRDWAPGYHLVNMLFHAANGALLYFILLALFKKKFLAFFAALIFLIHPAQTEAVSYTNSLGDSLSVFFMFLGLWMFLTAINNISQPYYKNWRYYFAVFCYSLALMSKETAIIMPALLGMVWRYSNYNNLLSESDSNYVLENKTVLLKITKIIVKGLEILGLFLVIAGVYILLRATILNFGGTFNLYGGERNLFVDSLGVRILTYFRIFSVYLGLLFWPKTLHMERGVEWVSNFAHFDVILGAVFFIFIFVVGIWQFIKRKPLGFGLLWFLIALAPTSNIAVPINGLLYEHWLYLPLAGFFIAVTFIIYSVWQKFYNWRVCKYLFSGVLVIFAFALLLRTVVRNLDWRDPITFYIKTLQYSPDSYRINNNLAMEYANRQNLEEAEKYYFRALKIEPEASVVYYNLGNLYVAQGKIEKAKQSYEQAINKDKEFWLAYQALINLYKATNRLKGAEDLYFKYLENIKKD